jgi:hypothetical protein
MISISENPAVTDPRKHLTPAQRDALAAIDFYRHQRRAGPEIIIGRKRFKASTIEALERHGLIRYRRPNYEPTLGGELALDHLKGKKP